MDTTTVVLIAIALLLVLILLEVPVGIALGMAGTAGIVLDRGSFAVAAQAMATIPHSAASRFVLVVIPMYIFMGVIASQARIAEDVFAVTQRAMRRLPGGLGVATIATCAGFAAVTGSSVATVATVARMSIQEMRRYGYPTRFAAGIVGSAGTLGILIPPSIALVIYGVLSGESIGRLLLAGIVPGVISALAYGVFVVLRARSLVLPPAEPTEAAVAGAGGHNPATAKARRGYGGLIRIAVLFAIVVGGIYSGVFTATESGALGAVTALLLLILMFWRVPKELVRRAAAGLREAASVTSTLFLIFIGSMIFSFFFVSAGVPSAFARWAIGLPVSSTILLILLLLALVPLGMLLDGISIMVIVVPLVHPVVTAMGFDGIWFAILVVKMIELGLITPPIGINAYVLAGSGTGIRVEDAFGGLVEFASMDVLVIILLFLIPALVTWLPSMAG